MTSHQVAAKRPGLFDPYKEGRTWFMVVDFTMNFAAGVVAGFVPEQQHCEILSYIALGVYGGYAVATIVLMPYRSTFDAIFFSSLACAQTVPLVINVLDGTALGNTTASKVASTWLPTGIYAAVTLRTVYDVFLLTRYVWRVFHKWYVARNPKEEQVSRLLTPPPPPPDDKPNKRKPHSSKRPSEFHDDIPHYSRVRVRRMFTIIDREIRRALGGAQTQQRETGNLADGLLEEARHDHGWGWANRLVQTPYRAIPTGGVERLDRVGADFLPQNDIATPPTIAHNTGPGWRWSDSRRFGTVRVNPLAAGSVL